VYSATYGHPLEREDLDPSADRIPLFRWAVHPVAAVVACLAVLALGGGVVVWSARTAPTDGVPLGIAVATASGATTAGGGRTGTSDDGALSGRSSPAPDDGSGSLPSSGDVGGVVVHVVGQVVNPGVVRLPAGARVTDAIAAAGGAAGDADLTAVNLARVLVDGEQILVPRPGEAVTPPQRPAGDAADVLVDLNAATLADLDALPGIGPVLAQRVLDWRTAHGRFADVEELAEVPGIGPSVLAGLRERVRV